MARLARKFNVVRRKQCKSTSAYGRAARLSECAFTSLCRRSHLGDRVTAIFAAVCERVCAACLSVRLSVAAARGLPTLVGVAFSRLEGEREAFPARSAVGGAELLLACFGVARRRCRRRKCIARSMCKTQRGSNAVR